MFYSQFILAKKGPLGTIWIAAHLERKLRKNQVADTDIGVSVDSILSPEVPIALRLSSHLLLGVVRIYSRKVNYLFHDCSEALLKVKQAFRSTAVDLPPEESTAPYHSITLPETFDLDDFELPDGDNFQGNFIDHHVSTREQITLQDSLDGVVYSTSQFGLDERFGDGDTSQALDLDEELFMDNVTATEGTRDLLDIDNVDHQASAQPMTPFMDMDMDVDIDDDDDNQIMTREDDDQATFGEDRILDAMLSDTNGQFGKETHGLGNEISESKFEDVIMQDLTNNLQYESEYCDPKFVGQGTPEDLFNKQNIHVTDMNEAGDRSLLNNQSSEADVSDMPSNAQEKQQGGSPAMVDLNPNSVNNNQSSEIDVPQMATETQERQQTNSPSMVDMNPNSFNNNQSSEIDVPLMPRDTEEKQQAISTTMLDLSPNSFNNNQNSEIDVLMPRDTQEKQQVISAAMLDLSPNSFNNNQNSEIDVLMPRDKQENQQVHYPAVVDASPSSFNNHQSSKIDVPHFLGDTQENRTWVSPAVVDINPIPSDNNHSSVAIVSATPLDRHEKHQGGSPAVVNMKPISFDINQSSEMDVSHMSHCTKGQQEGFPAGVDMNLISFDINQSSERQNSRMSQDTKGKQQEGFPAGVDMNLISFDINQSSERQNSHMSQDTQGKQQGDFPSAVDMNIISFDINQSSEREGFYTPQDMQGKQGVFPSAMDMNLLSFDINQNSEREASHVPQDTQEKQQEGFPGLVDMNLVSFDNNQSSEGEFSNMHHGTQEKQQGGSSAVVDMNPISLDVGRKVSSPTSVLTEQLKPTSPAPGILERDSALPGIRGRTEQLGDTYNVNPSSSDASHMYAVGVSTRDIIMDMTPTTLAVTSDKPIPSSESLFTNYRPINDCQIISGDTSQKVWGSHGTFGSNAHTKVGSEGNFPDLCTPYGSNPPFGSVGAHGIDQDERRACLGPEAVAPQHLLGRNEESCDSRHMIRPCSSFPKQPDASSVARNLLNASDSSSRGEPSSWGSLGREEHIHASGLGAMVQGEDYQPNYTRDTASKAKKISESVPLNGLEAYLSNTNSVISKDIQSGNFNWSAFSGVVPEPERLLSVPATAPIPSSNFQVLPAFRSEMSAERDINGNGFTSLSGRKRQLMESPPVQYGGSSVEFFGMQSRKTVDSVPKDSDILSSILGERRLSVPQLRPTPQQSDIASKKRQKKTPRTSVAKRKVLLDDTMVLHGDTIRQQLTSTEDIRRIRKKAPCTRTEIWMIQKYLLEEEIFSEPLFTGMSPGLINVHNRTYAVTDSRVSEMDEVHTLSEVPAKKLLPESTNLTGEANTQETCEPVMVSNDGLVNTPKEIFTDSANRLTEDRLINPIECDIQEQTRPVTGMFPFDSQNVPLDMAATSTVKGSGEGCGVADGMDHVGTIMSDSLLTVPVSKERYAETAGSGIEPLSVDNRRGEESGLQYKGTSDIQSVENNLFIPERNSSREDDTSHAPKSNDDGRQTVLQNDRISDIQSVERDTFPGINSAPKNNDDGRQTVLQNDRISDIQSVERDIFAGINSAPKNNDDGCQTILQNDCISDIQSVERDTFAGINSAPKNNDDGRQTILQNDRISDIQSVERDTFAGINSAPKNNDNGRQMILQNDRISDIQSVERDTLAGIISHRGDDVIHGAATIDGHQMILQHNRISDIQSVEKDVFITERTNQRANDDTHITINNGGCHTIVPNNGITDVHSVEKDVFITERNSHNVDNALRAEPNNDEGCQTILQNNGISYIQSAEKEVIIGERNKHGRDDANHLKIINDEDRRTILQDNGISDMQSVEKDVLITERSNHGRDGASDVAENNDEGHRTMLQSNGISDIQPVEKNVFISEINTHGVDGASSVAQIDKECLLLTDSAHMEKDGSIQEIAESSSANVILQNTPQHHQDDVVLLVNSAHMERDGSIQEIPESSSVRVNTPQQHHVDVGCSSSVNAVLDDCLIENDRSLFPNISVPSDVCSDTTVVINDSTNEKITSELGHVNTSENVKDDGRNLASKFTSIENPERDIICPSKFNANTETVPSDEGANSGSKEAALERTVNVENLGSAAVSLEGTVDAETTLLGNASVLSCDLGNTLDENDTEFLNFNDDGAIEEDSKRPTVEEASLLDTSGWSARTRGVARYLKTVFDTESGRGREVLPINKLLTGKTRTEASRMFFETLVLKTRDYIHVEQEKPFDVINVKPKGKLMKSNF